MPRWEYAHNTEGCWSNNTSYQQAALASRQPSYHPNSSNPAHLSLAFSGPLYNTRTFFQDAARPCSNLNQRSGSSETLPLSVPSMSFWTGGGSGPLGLGDAQGGGQHGTEGPALLRSFLTSASASLELLPPLLCSVEKQSMADSGSPLPYTSLHEGACNSKPGLLSSPLSKVQSPRSARGSPRNGAPRGKAKPLGVVEKAGLKGVVLVCKTPGSPAAQVGAGVGVKGRLARKVAALMPAWVRLLGKQPWASRQGWVCGPGRVGSRQQTLFL